MRYGAAKILADDEPPSPDHHVILPLFSALMGGHTAASHTDGMVRIWDVRTGPADEKGEGAYGWVDLCRVYARWEGFGERRLG
jgi:hypothetical protein